MDVAQIGNIGTAPMCHLEKRLQMNRLGGRNMDEKEVVNVVKDPTSYSWLAYAWVVLLSMWGGAVSFYQKVKNGTTDKWSITELVGELITSAFSGVMAFYLCEFGGLPPLLTAVCVAISGHMGARGIFMLEQVVKKKFGVQEEK